MQYFGGKNRTCKSISKVIQQNIKDINQPFISAFVGGGWVESLINSNNKECYDKHPYLISMYQELQKGWEPPDTLSKEEYDYIKNNPDENPFLTGFVGFGCSFSGKWFGGYARNVSGRNYCKNAKNSVINKMQGFMDTKFNVMDYSNLNPINSIVYCDPPYDGTTQYSEKILGSFNSDKFWETIRKWSSNNIVFVSEYNAPKDFITVWQMAVKLDIRDKNNEKKARIEKLFVHEDRVKDVIL